MQVISDNYEAWQEGIEFARHNEPQVETEKAIGLSKRGTKDQLVWIPKSQVCAALDGGILRMWIKPWFLSKLKAES